VRSRTSVRCALDFVEQRQRLSDTGSDLYGRLASVQAEIFTRAFRPAAPDAEPVGLLDGGLGTIEQTHSSRSG
jgi:hypothetical protein